jgi:hypothetical protein
MRRLILFAPAFTAGSREDERHPDAQWHEPDGQSANTARPGDLA